jgi:uncharacterized protein YkwD
LAKWRLTWIRFTLVIIMLSILSPLTANSLTNTFSDVKGHWASDTIAWAVENSIVSGYPDGTFRPNHTVSEPEFLAMLLRAYPKIVIPVAGKNKPWYEPYYLLAEDYNWPLLHDTDGKLFNRGSVAHLLAATQGNNLSMPNAVQYVLDTGIANGKTSTTLAGFGFQDVLKRSEALTLIKNMDDSGLKLVKARGEIIPVHGSTASFTVRGIAIGDSKQEVIDQLGVPARYALSEYGFDWYIYNQDYANYIQVGIHAGSVVGMYSNVDNWSAKSGMHIGSSSSEVKKAYGKGLTSIRKGNTRFLIDESSQNESPKYLIDGSYVNFFLDKHSNNTVTAIQIIEEEMEMSLRDFHGKPSDKLRKSFESQVFDLANSVRVRFGKKAFIWSEQIALTARKHSKDMADHDYFAHTNLSGLSPFDRMQDDGINYLSAAENIAEGQSSAIFAHEGWMNSKGHRVNILADIERLGVGVYLGGSYEAYYTQNFFTPYE